MKLIVLGSAAGGGFPQWNSNAEGCRRARTGDPVALSRTQTSLAVSADGRRWFVLNAAPDLRAQIQATPALWPTAGLRSSPIAGVALTGGDVDALAGLLDLRERHRFNLYATRSVLGVLASNRIFEVLAPDCVTRLALPLDQTIALADPERDAPALFVRAFAVPGKVPLYLEGPNFDPEKYTEDDTTVGLELWQDNGRKDGGAHAFFIPGCAAMTERLAARLAGAPLVLFDGTLWTDDEMIRLGLGAKTGRRMGHMSVMGSDANGTGGTIAAFRALGIARKIFVHINNSNPMLLADSSERRAALAAGWDVGHDGMELEL
ncbi:MAG: pyrroloquinoline quinone biosynthesis protein PqqB [Proteobacteria bacterium]|nr:pyrroloquinoline quinone biosynthesis protein PqqB [Pseudomonadota bacterium]